MNVDVENWRKQHAEDLCFADKLNEAGVHPSTDSGKVVGLLRDDSELSDEELVALGLDPGDLGSVCEHPEGSDRGGYVPFVGRVYYDENGGVWRPGG